MPYTQDVEFNSDFGALQTPMHICTAAMLCGEAGFNITGHFRYLDIACGNGHTLTLLADAYPHAEFVGIDINSAHIAKANALAEQAGVRNVQFIEADIAELDSADYRVFDVCTLSGLYSWLDPLRQRKMLQFVDRVVRSGGIFYLDYSAMPGGTQTSSLYQIIQKLSSEYHGDSADKLTGASKLLATISNTGGQFFKQNEQAAQRLSNILRNPAEDEAHEVLNLQPQGLWSGDVIVAMAQYGFAFVGSAGLQHNLPELSAHLAIPEEVSSFPVATRQLVQDVVWNVGQRKDIYIKGALHEPRSLVISLQEYGFYIAPEALSEQKIAFVLKQFPGADRITRTNISRLQEASSCRTFAELTLHFKGLDYTEDELNVLFRQLLATRIVSLAQPLRPEYDESLPLKMPSELNRIILEQDIHLEHGRPFSSFIIGSRLILPIKDRLYLWAIVLGDLEAVWGKLGDLRQAFYGPDGKPLDSKEFAKIITQSLPAFKVRVAPELVRLGILTQS